MNARAQSTAHKYVPDMCPSFLQISVAWRDYFIDKISRDGTLPVR
jgi:hypothetical protein